MKSLSPVEIRNLIDEGYPIVLLDIREPYEYEFCNVGGIHIPMAEVVGRLDEFAKEQEICIMCNSGKRAGALANLLITEFNFLNISIVEGGIMAWKETIDRSLELE